MTSMTKLPDFGKKIAMDLAEDKGNFKLKLTDFMTKEIVAGAVKNRSELVGTLKD